MILYKIHDKTIFRAVFVIIALWNLKYFFLIAQVPFTLMFKDYMQKNSFYSDVSAIRENVKNINDFYDKGTVGFYTDLPKAKVFDIQDSIRAFYVAQYAITPAILKNETNNEKYVIGNFEKKYELPAGFKLEKQANKEFYIYINTKAE